jgi:CubicO group peptidase (beta-lactamase class C family)
LRFLPVDDGPVDDERLADPPSSITAPAALAATLREQFGRGGMVGLVAAGWRGPEGGPDVSVEMGWADLEAGVAATLGHRFAAYSITKLFTAVAVLQLVARAEVELDAPANGYLTTLRLASDAATVRQLLTHTAGVGSSFEHWVEEVPASMVDVLGAVVAHDIEPGGPYIYSNGGYAVLGQLVADVTARPYEAVVADTILTPLGLLHSDFPRMAPWPAEGVASGHQTAEGRIAPAPRLVAATPAAGGLWTTAADLARFAFGWSALVPDELASLVGVRSPGLWGHNGGGVGFRSALWAKPDDGLVAVAFSNRRDPVDAIAWSILDAMA